MINLEDACYRLTIDTDIIDSIGIYLEFKIIKILRSDINNAMDMPGNDT